MWKPLNSAAQFGYRTAFGLFELPMAGTQRLVGISRIAWVFLLPNLLIFGLFTFLPIILNFFYATTGSDAILLSQRPYVGAENFSSLLSCTNYLDPNTCRRDVFWRAVYNTGWFVVLQVGFMVAFSLLTALVLNRNIRAQGLLPRRLLLSRAALAGRRRADLEVDPAALRRAERRARGPRPLHGQLADRRRTGPSSGSIFVSIWAHMGFYTLILLAGLQSIPRDVYEAAEMDGASRWRVFAKITMPLSDADHGRRAGAGLIRAVQAFDEIFAFTGGGPGSATTLIIQYIYETGFAGAPQLFGLAAAASILLAVVLVVLTLLQLRATRSQAEG